MNFSSESVKLKSKPQNEDFYFDLETPRGHFFAVFDFAPHDYANLDAKLRGKLETIVGSSVSLSKFSPDLFLGFLAQKINNFLHNLAEQSGGPDLRCSAALCLVNGDQLSYLLCSDVKISVLSDGQLMPLHGFAGPDFSSEESEENPDTSMETNKEGQLGVRSMEVPLTDEVETYNLKDDDVVLIMTSGIEEALKGPEITDEISRMENSKSIHDAIMKASAAIDDDRTLVVIGGPYEKQLDAVADLSKAIAELEARVSALTIAGEKSTQPSVEKESDDSGQLEQRFNQQIEELKGDLKGKAASSDLLELEEKIRNLSVALDSKADSEMPETQNDPLSFGAVSTAGNSAGVDEMAEAGNTLAASDSNPAIFDDSATGMPTVTQEPPARSVLGLRSALLILLIATGGAFIGTWVQSRVLRRPQEVRLQEARPQEIWSVKTSGNQIVISRLDAGGGQGSVALNVAQPVNSTGEQTFSSFADVKQYIDTITTSGPLDQNTPTAQSTLDQNTPTGQSTDAKEKQSALPEPSKRRKVATKAAVTEITIKPGDSLNRLAQRYNVTPEKIMKLNPTITSWPRVRTGQKIVVPAAP